MLDVSVTGFLDCHLCQRLGAGNPDFRDFKQDSFNLLFRKLFESRPRLMRGREQTSSFLNGLKIFVHEGIIPEFCLLAESRCATNDSESSRFHQMGEE